jgi:hypothetical protein
MVMRENNKEENMGLDLTIKSMRYFYNIAYYGLHRTSYVVRRSSLILTSIFVEMNIHLLDMTKSSYLLPGTEKDSKPNR